jgi:ribonuclease HII
MSTKENNIISAVIIDDSDEDKKDEEFIEIDESQTNIIKNKNVKSKPKKSKKINKCLDKCIDENMLVIEIGIDEAGRGPLFGRVYSGAVVLPKDDSFDHSKMKDSKKFHSKKKIEEVAEYIKENAIAWSVCYEDEDIIDSINILQATQSAMHKAIKDVLNQLKLKINEFNHNNVLLLVDGNYFKQYTIINKQTNKIDILNYRTIE